VHKDDHYKFETIFENVISGKSDRISLEYSFLHQNGNYKWIYIKGKCLKYDNGIPKFIAGSCSDIDVRNKSYCK